MSHSHRYRHEPELTLPGNAQCADSPSRPQHGFKYFITTGKCTDPTIPGNTVTLILPSDNTLAKYSSTHAENFPPSRLPLGVPIHWLLVGMEEQPDASSCNDLSYSEKKYDKISPFMVECTAPLQHQAALSAPSKKCCSALCLSSKTLGVKRSKQRKSNSR